MIQTDFNEKSVFLQALMLPQEEREAFLDVQCPSDEARERIRTLLAHHQEASDEFLSVHVAGEEYVSRDPTQIEEFKVIRRLGQGGMSIVYLAEDTILGRQVAIKVLARHAVGSQESLIQFRREARAAASLQHPAIVPVFKFGYSGNDFYLVTEFVDGPTLKQLIAEKIDVLKNAKTIDLRQWYKQTAEIVAAIADALDCAHRAQIVHRDIKPSNVLMDPRHGPRLADFGIAKSLAQNDQTMTTALVGTYHYMSPEQADLTGADLDQRSDIFSLGVVLYEMLALRQPFVGATMHHVLNAVVTCNPPKLRTMNRRIPIDLQTICHKALEKQPRDRYQSAAHVAADLRSFLVGDPILARPPSLPRRAWRSMRLHRNLFSAAAVFGLALAVFAIWWQHNLHERSRHCMVQVTCPAVGARLVIQQIDPVTHEPGRTVHTGAVAGEVALLPGQYRMLAVQSPEVFSEANVFLDKPGVTVRQALPQPYTSDSFDGMVRFDGGPTIVGRNDPKAGEQERTVNIAPFWLDVAEVSNADYQRFLDATGHTPPLDWAEIKSRPALADRPVINVTWADANAYCQFIGKRLPTVNEWECAMRYPDGRIYPWGDKPPEAVTSILDEFEECTARLASGDRLAKYVACSHPVRSDPALCSSKGLFHGASNVAELTETIDQRGSTRFFLKGGSYIVRHPRLNSAEERTLPLRSTNAAGQVRDVSSMEVGFRCARSDRATAK